MDDDKIFKRLLFAASLWMLIAAVTYGHAVKQFKQESEAECISERKVRPDAYCSDSMVRPNAFFASMLWPQHWSEYLWQ